MSDSPYSFSLTTFSPSGKLVQIEHALTVVGPGQTSLGIKELGLVAAASGVVIATEKKLPSILVDETSVQKIQILTANIGVVYSGMGPDSRVLVRKSRKQAEQYYCLYKESIPVTQLVKETVTVMQEFTQSGLILLIESFSYGKECFYCQDIPGEEYTEEMKLDDAVHTAILTLKEGFEGKISGKSLEIGVIGSDRIFNVLSPSEVEDYLQEAE